MKGTYTRQHQDKQGRTRFVYVISGTAEEIDAYKASQGQYYLEGDDQKEKPNEFGKPIWRAFEFAGDICEIHISKNNKVYADMSELRKQASLVKQFGGDFGNAIAQQAATQLFSNKAKAPQQPNNTTETSSADSVEGL